ncbi:hypothetical protein CDEST_00643 [Colletotrichum destructivum]|uniref:Uncharacterized protein n=1 Tax=Colletotrichum destructivum TaxID=34406 RepID=A0AAX4HXJ7_9PEZI|nr:hypothetical protein CDEST_00643 [Colletotrichum destructivum]
MQPLQSPIFNARAARETRGSVSSAPTTTSHPLGAAWRCRRLGRDANRKSPSRLVTINSMSHGARASRNRLSRGCRPGRSSKWHPPRLTRWSPITTYQPPPACACSSSHLARQGCRLSASASHVDMRVPAAQSRRRWSRLVAAAPAGSALQLDGCRCRRGKRERVKEKIKKPQRLRTLALGAWFPVEVIQTHIVNTYNRPLSTWVRRS